MTQHHQINKQHFLIDTTQYLKGSQTMQSLPIISLLMSFLLIVSFPPNLESKPHLTNFFMNSNDWNGNSWEHSQEMLMQRALAQSGSGQSVIEDETEADFTWQDFPAGILLH